MENWVNIDVEKLNVSYERTRVKKLFGYENPKGGKK